MTSSVAAPRVPLLDLVRQTTEIRHELDAAIARVLDHGKFILGPEVESLEQAVASYCGSRYAVSCASGTDALLLPLMALDIGPGDLVITSPFTFFATAGSISRLGATPVFLDIDPGTYNLSPPALRDYLASLPPGDLRRVKAVIPVHLFGQCADMDQLAAVLEPFGIPMIEDAAQSIGAEFRGHRAGSMGLCGSFSFFPSKNLGGFGDGGLMTTNDAAFAEKLRILRVHGSQPKYYHPFVGINSRLDTLQAAILLVKLPHLESWTEARRVHAAAYNETFSSLPAIGRPAEAPACRHVFNQYTIRVPNRDAVRALLSESGVATDIYYPVPLHLQECFAGLGYEVGSLPHSERAGREVLSIPIDPCMTGEERESVALRVQEALAKAQL